MRICLECGKEIRDGADFCTSCGAPAPAEGFSGAAGGQGGAANGAPNGADSGAQTRQDPGQPTEAQPQGQRIEVPLITLAPQSTPLSKDRLIHTGVLVGGVVLVIALVLGVLFLLAYLNNDPFQTSSIETVEDDSYNKCLALVRDVRNQNFAEMIDDIIQMDGDYQDYNFLAVYEGLFKELIPTEGSDASAVKFRNCCFMVAYTEFIAKKYESYTDDFLGSMYIDDAEKFRGWADDLWERLQTAQSDAELDYIVDFCAEKDIIYLKNDAK